MSRTVRFMLNPDGAAVGANGHGGVPAPSGLAIFTEFEIRCEGFPDPATGYLINIKEIDQAARAVLFPPLAAAITNGAAVEPMQRILDFAPLLAEDLQGRFKGSLSSLLWRLTPTCSIEVVMNTQADPIESNIPSTVLLRQRSEFAASHRLHVPELDDATNRELFGKCNSPNGHGHNYVVEPCVAISSSGISDSPAFTVGMLEGAVERAILSRFDHTHLNLDTAEFGTSGLNPSVENIARVCYELLADELSLCVQGDGVRLQSITIWETERTSCTYPG